MGKYKEFEKIIYRYTHEASELGGQAAVDTIELGHRFHFEDKDALNFLKENAVQLSESSLSRLNGDINKVIAEGIKNGAPIREITKEVKGIFNDFRGYEAERIARTEIARGTNNGALVGYDGMGIKVVEIYSNPGACPLCRARHGDLMSIDQATNTLPLHPNCYCFWLPRADITNPNVDGWKSMGDISGEIVKGLAIDTAFRRVSMAPETMVKLKTKPGHIPSPDEVRLFIETADMGFIDEAGQICLVSPAESGLWKFAPIKETEDLGNISLSGYYIGKRQLTRQLKKARKTYGF
ncbi:MAG: hypothetical protein AVO39_10200 [delta proteobacterium MLS_D]|nr:MAG: hypothetical protein AVO39_10200 [delta proteobacterium MLS_D]